ncbi:hypothetical protein DNTS_028306 [Danionella cerebrum]|uniref:RING-type E3 ubiquitin transferase n=1 Tax=Danionella cerebrum TaxID=2873325 RepID=A0A553NL79_9TELE|nr:hypothetical protein DNTS_028306 [Danionella translucida]
MLRGPVMFKNRCCLLFRDFKVHLLGPQHPTNSMSGQVDKFCPDPPDNSHSSRAHRLRDWSSPSVEEPPVVEAEVVEVSRDRRFDDRFSFISYAEGTPVCRICFQGPEKGELLSPCRCSGSVRSTHQPCLIKWISERGSWTCELCYYKYQVIAISTKNPLQWQAISLTVIEKVQIAAAVLGSLFLIASISWLVWSSLSPSARWQRQDLLFQICYGMYGFMDLVCIALIIHEGPSVFRIFHRWQAVNQQWKVLNYDKKRDSAELKNTEDQSQSLLQENRTTGHDVSPSPSSIENSSMVLPQHLLNLLSQLRPHETQHANSSKAREVVMRVTTV